MTQEITISDFVPIDADGNPLVVDYGGKPRIENEGGGEYTGYMRKEGNGQSIGLYMHSSASLTPIYAIPTADITAGMCGLRFMPPGVDLTPHYSLICGWAGAPGFDSNLSLIYNEYNGSATTCDVRTMTDTDEWKCIPTDSFSVCQAILVTVKANANPTQTAAYIDMTLWDGASQIGGAVSENIIPTGNAGDYSDFEFSWSGLSEADLSDFRVRVVARPGAVGPANKAIEIYGVTVQFMVLT